MKYGVDIAIWAHEHTYERAWPVYDYKVYNGSTEHPYVNPRYLYIAHHGHKITQRAIEKVLYNTIGDRIRNDDIQKRTTATIVLW